jgi:hypothetical protein
MAVYFACVAAGTCPLEAGRIVAAVFGSLTSAGGSTTSAAAPGSAAWKQEVCERQQSSSPTAGGLDPSDWSQCDSDCQCASCGGRRGQQQQLYSHPGQQLQPGATAIESQIAGSSTQGSDQLRIDGDGFEFEVPGNGDECAGSAGVQETTNLPSKPICGGETGGDHSGGRPDISEQEVEDTTWADQSEKPPSEKENVEVEVEEGKLINPGAEAQQSDENKSGRTRLKEQLSEVVGSFEGAEAVQANVSASAAQYTEPSKAPEALADAAQIGLPTT